MSSKFVGFKIYFYTLLLLLRFVADLGVSFWKWQKLMQKGETVGSVLHFPFKNADVYWFQWNISLETEAEEHCDRFEPFNFLKTHFLFCTDSSLQDFLMSATGKLSDQTYYKVSSLTVSLFLLYLEREISLSHQVACGREKDQLLAKFSQQQYCFTS